MVVKFTIGILVVIKDNVAHQHGGASPLGDVAERKTNPTEVTALFGLFSLFFLMWLTNDARFFLLRFPTIVFLSFSRDDGFFSKFYCDSSDVLPHLIKKWRTEQRNNNYNTFFYSSGIRQTHDIRTLRSTNAGLSRSALRWRKEMRDNDVRPRAQSCVSYASLRTRVLSNRVSKLSPNHSGEAKCQILTKYLK